MCGRCWLGTLYDRRMGTFVRSKNEKNCYDSELSDWDAVFK